MVLCYRSEESAVAFAQAVKEVALEITDSFEIILVGNYVEGSGDKTGDYIRQIAAQDPVFKAISEPKNGMMGWDVRKGLAITSGELLCFIDGDGQFPIESIATCYEKMKTKEFGLVKTHRINRKDGFSRNLISVVYNLVFKVMYPRVKSRDVNSKPKMFRREVYEAMNLSYDDWFIDAEMMIKASRLKIKFHECPIEFMELKGRKSFVNFSTILEFARNLIIFRLRRK